MTHNWKPGDVAAWDGPGGSEVIYFRLAGDNFDEPGWQTATGGEGYPREREIRPLVVIDLSEQPVEGDLPGRNESQMLISMLRETAENFFTPDAAALALNVAAQIEAQTTPPTPPRPDEPTGLGAVVEDADGVRWVSWRSGLDFHDRPWQRLEMNTDEFRNYADIAAVTTHFEGVTP